MSNGLHMSVVYPEAVHYQKDGIWMPIDNTLKLESSAYTNTAGLWSVQLPQNLTAKKPVTVRKDGYTLRFTMSGQLTGTLEANADAEAALRSLTLSETASVQAQVQAVASPWEGSRYPETVPQSLYSRLMYEDIYAQTDLVYDLSGNTLKESIVLQSHQANLQGYYYTMKRSEMV